MSDRVALNADIVAYSRLMADDFEATTRAVGNSQQIVERHIEENHGVLVDFAGDNFMAVFDDPMDAMRTSISISTDLEEENLERPETRRLMFRMGLDQGTVEVSEGQYFGDALNIAARIQSLAPPGGVSVSGTVYKALDEPELRFRPRGRQRLKNIPEPVDVYDFADLPTPGTRPHSPSALDFDKPTIAVLPFHRTLQDEALEPAIDVVRADLIHRLAQIPNLDVIDAGRIADDSVTSVARYMIESGAHQVGDQVRLYSTLFDVTTMNLVKSHKWTVASNELIDVSESVAQDMATSIEVELVIGEPAAIYAELADPVAIQNVYLGWYHLSAETRQGWLKARELFSSVAAEHPESPMGHSLVAFSWWIGLERGLTTDRDQVFEEATVSAQKGVALGDPTGLSHMVLAAVLLAKGQPGEAVDMVEQAVVTRPTCDVSYGVEGSVRRYLGEWDRSVDLMDNAMRLSAMTKPWYPTVKACALYMGGKSSEASSLAENVLEHQPKNLEALLILAAAQHDQGLERRARATARTVKDQFPSIDIEKWIDDNPYENEEAVARWKTSLRSLDLIHD